MKRIVFSLLLITSYACNARVLNFLQTDFDSFVSQVVAEQDRERFKGYYSKLQEQIEIEDTDKQKKTREYLYTCCFRALERDKPSWHHKLNSFLGPDYLDTSYDQEREQVREFVYWYGALEEFNQAKQPAPHNTVALTEREKQKTGFLSNAKSYVAKATQKVGNWFKGLRSSTS